MTSVHSKKLIEELIVVAKWKDCLQRFMSVLRINLFLVDPLGRVIVSPLSDGGNFPYGGGLLSEMLRCSGAEGENFLRSFAAFGDYKEFKGCCDLHAFMIPLKGYGLEFAYMVVGPVILNKRLDDEVYRRQAAEYGFSPEDVLNHVNELRVVSHIAMNGILDLLATIGRELVDMQAENQILQKRKLQRDVFPEGIAEEVEALYETASIDELLVSVLEIALRLSGASSGSIMMVDEEQKNLSVRVSRGLDTVLAGRAVTRIGEGVSGVAVRDNRAFMIKGTDGDSTIRTFLKRSNLSDSAVIPLAGRNRVHGVLNINATDSNNLISSNFSYLQNLSRLVSTVLDV
ncbi:MAG TPA: GAF domain-containing protein [Candidatus Omnitrophota bacterium]|nr:GAF domain-containing protein [Candidatus Omnitrophota bacterium]HSA31642.1 GAF domain-containing protein [Candidatus Omnitrophota bacterium]